jgi:uncharacterized protein (DUF1778 family)
MVCRKCSDDSEKLTPPVRKSGEGPASLQENNMATTTKTERIEARTSPAIRELIEKAALLEGRSLSDYIISRVTEAARRTIESHNQIALSERDQQAFAKSLLNPKPAPEALKRAVQSHNF